MKLSASVPAGRSTLFANTVGRVEVYFQYSFVQHGEIKGIIDCSVGVRCIKLVPCPFPGHIVIG